MCRKIFRSLEGVFATCQVPCKGETWEETQSLPSRGASPLGDMNKQEDTPRAEGWVPKEPTGHGDKPSCPPGLGCPPRVSPAGGPESWTGVAQAQRPGTRVHITWHIFFFF